MKRPFIYILTLLSLLSIASAEKEIGKTVWSYIDEHREAIISYEKEGGKIPDKSEHYLNFVKHESELYDMETNPIERMFSIRYLRTQMAYLWGIISYYEDDIEKLNQKRTEWQKAAVLLIQDERKIMEQLKSPKHIQSELSTPFARSSLTTS